MARVKRGNVLRNRHKKILKLAKSFKGARSRIFKVANIAVMKALCYQYRDRRTKKKEICVVCGLLESTLLQECMA